MNRNKLLKKIKGKKAMIEQSWNLDGTWLIDRGATVQKNSLFGLCHSFKITVQILFWMSKIEKLKQNKSLQLFFL